jgi:hypothetical protein
VQVGGVALVDLPATGNTGMPAPEPPDEERARHDDDGNERCLHTGERTATSKRLFWRALERENDLESAPERVR